MKTSSTWATPYASPASSGTVEAMTLRKTTVRDADGTLYVIPNSQITTVANLSVGYSIATVNVSVDFSANPDEVLEAT